MNDNLPPWATAFAYLVVGVLGVFAIYLTSAFIAWTPYPDEWGWFQRVLVVIAVVALLFQMFEVAVDNDGDDDLFI